MAGDEIQLKKTDSILNEVAQLHDDISRRAYDFFCGHQDLYVEPLEDWFRAERELVRSPAIELRQKDNQFELEASVAGVDPQDLDVQVTPQDILIKGQTRHQHEAQDGTVHVSEFKSRQLFRSIHLPDPIDPDSAKAEYRNGLLRLTMKVAKATPKKVGVQAA